MLKLPELLSFPPTLSWLPARFRWTRQYDSLFPPLRRRPSSFFFFFFLASLFYVRIFSTACAGREHEAVPTLLSFFFCTALNGRVQHLLSPLSFPFSTLPFPLAFRSRNIVEYGSPQAIPSFFAAAWRLLRAPTPFFFPPFLQLAAIMSCRHQLAFFLLQIALRSFPPSFFSPPPHPSHQIDSRLLILLFFFGT